MLTILNDPAGISGRRRVSLDYSLTLQANIERHLAGGDGAEMRINGVIIDPLTDRRLDMPPGRDDLITITLRPALDIAAWGVYEWALAASVALSVYSYTAARNISGAAENAAGKDSPNNKLTAQTNVARAYQAIPDVYGYRRVWPDLIQPSTVEYVSNLKYVTEWLCVSRGKGTIEDVRYAETPIGDIDGSSFEVFEPVPPLGGAYAELGDTTISDVNEAFASDEVNGQELPYAIAFPTLNESGSYNAVAAATTFTIQFTDGPQFAKLKSLSPTGTAQVSFTYGAGPTLFDQTCTVQSYSVVGPNVTFTFTSTAWAGNESGSATITIVPNGTDYTTIGPFTLPIDCDQIWFNTVFLRGQKGAVVVRAEWWKVDANGVEIGGTRQNSDTTFTDDTYDQRFYTTKITPSAGSGRYRIEFQRRTVAIDPNGADVAKLEELFAVRRFETKTLPGVTVIRVTTKATLAATGFSDRKFNLRWTRHVRGLESDAISASRNFARVMAHIWTLAGKPIGGLDTSTLLAVNDKHGEDSLLLRFDGSLDDADMSLGERLRFVAGTARCEVWRDGTKWTVTREEAKPHPELQLDYRNLAAGSESSLSYAAHLPASNDGVELEYVDEATQAKKAYIRLNIATGAPVPGSSGNPKKIRMPGCATLAQADNRARLEARRLLYQRSTVSDTALGDVLLAGHGALVRWVDPNDFGGDGLQAGEVMSVAGSAITTSEQVDFAGHSSGRIVFTGEDGRVIGSGPVTCTQNADGSLQIADVPGGLYVADADRQCGSRYAFAPGLTEAEIQAAGLFTVTDVRPQTNGQASVALAAYDDRMFADD